MRAARVGDAIRSTHPAVRRLQEDGLERGRRSQQVAHPGSSWPVVLLYPWGYSRGSARSRQAAAFDRALNKTPGTCGHLRAPAGDCVHLRASGGSGRGPRVSSLAPVACRAVRRESVAALAEAAPGRFAFGLGTSCEVIVEQWNGIALDRRYARVRDTLAFLLPPTSLPFDRACSDWPDGRRTG